MDYVVPMAYLMNNEELRKDLEEYRAADPQMQRIIPGLSVYQRGADGQAASRSPELVASQVELCRQLGARGVVLFSFANFSQEIAVGLGDGLFKEPAEAYFP